MPDISLGQSSLTLCIALQQASLTCNPLEILRFSKTVAALTDTFWQQR